MTGIDPCEVGINLCCEERFSKKLSRDWSSRWWGSIPNLGWIRISLFADCTWSLYVGDRSLCGRVWSLLQENSQKAKHVSKDQSLNGRDRSLKHNHFFRNEKPSWLEKKVDTLKICNKDRSYRVNDQYFWVWFKNLVKKVR